MSQHPLTLHAPSRGPDQSGEPIRPDAFSELIEVRRLFEPATAALAAARVTDGDLAQFATRLEAMAAARHDAAAFIRHDAAFHRAVASATGNRTLMDLLACVSAHSALAGLPPGILDGDATDIVLAEHAAIRAALAARDPALAHAAALLHVNTTERWLRRHLSHARDLGRDNR